MSNYIKIAEALLLLAIVVPLAFIIINEFEKAAPSEEVKKEIEWFKSLFKGTVEDVMKMITKTFVLVIVFVIIIVVVRRTRGGQAYYH